MTESAFILQNSFSHADMYQLLTIFLQFPTKSLMAGFIDGSVTEDVLTIFNELNFKGQELETLRKDLETLWKDLETLRVLPADEDALLSEMRCEYTRLFAHPDSPAVPIYETMFLYDPAKDDSRPALFISPVSMDAKRCYKNAGAVLSNESNEPADHMAKEMEFMMHLYRLKAQTLQENNKVKLAAADNSILEFTEVHLKKWALAFFDKFASVSRSKFYKVIGSIGSFYLRQVLP